MSRIFLLSPAHCGGERARRLLDPRARLDLARRVRAGPEPTLGEVFSFLSGLYFRGKLAYARAFAAPPPGLPGILVITASDGLRLPDEPLDLARLQRFADTDIRPGEPRYEAPLLRDARRLAASLAPADEVILLGSVATCKYTGLLLPALGASLAFPAAFVGRGDMSRGGLLLRSAAAGIELDYVPVGGSPRRGARPARLARLG